MKPKVLKNDLEYEMALNHVESIMEQPETAIINDEIELFTTLISIYEEENFPIDLPDPIDAILFVMDQQGLSRKDLVPIIGSQSKVSEILNRNRPLSLSMMRRLHEELNIPAAILLQDTQQQQIPIKHFRNDDYPVFEIECVL
ncbi:MAG: DNA-binding protein [Sphaerochaeta sp.]|nr:DNA-binding protein [Sphaerochaeta sp.]